MLSSLRLRNGIRVEINITLALMDGLTLNCLPCLGKCDASHNNVIGNSVIAMSVQFIDRSVFDSMRSYVYSIGEYWIVKCKAVWIQARFVPAQATIAGQGGFMNRAGSRGMLMSGPVGQRQGAEQVGSSGRRRYRGGRVLSLTLSLPPAIFSRSFKHTTEQERVV